VLRFTGTCGATTAPTNTKMKLTLRFSILLAFALSFVQAFGAIGAFAVWECEPGVGVATNGGGYDSSLAGAGTDYTQSATPIYTESTATTSSSTLVVGTLGTFTSAMIGNAIYLSDAPTQRYFITAVPTAFHLTVDRATAATTAGSVTLHIGGALDGSSATMVALFNSGCYPANGNTIYCLYNASNSCSIATTLTFASGSDATSGRCLTVVGYATTRTLTNRDANLPVWTTTANVGQIVSASNGIIIRNISANGGNFGQNGWQMGGTCTAFFRCNWSNVNSGNAYPLFYGASQTGETYCIECTATGQGLNIGFSGCMCIGCTAVVDTGGIGYSQCNSCTNCLAKGAGAGTGFMNNGTLTGFTQCVAYDVATGFTSNSSPRPELFQNCIASTCTTGFTASSGVYGFTFLYGDAYYNCSTGVNASIFASNIMNGGGVAASAISCPSGDPFVSASGGNFTLSSAGIIDLGAKGYYLVAGTAETGYPDIGAYQHQATGGTSGGHVIGGEILQPEDWWAVDRWLEDQRRAA
jgi:hypothetical protein